jgi:sugar phosphate isomerase/epimerase
MFKNLSAAALGVTGHQSEIIELALTYGFQGMDIDIGEFATRTKLHGLPYARRLINSARFRLGTFALPLELDADDAIFAKRVQRLAEFSQLAAEIGCTRCVTIIAPDSDKRPYHENFEFCRYRLTTVAKAMEPAGIRLGVGYRAAEYLRRGQAYQFIHDLDALTLLLSMIAADNIGLLLNVWEVYAGGGSLETIRGIQPGQIVAVEVANLPNDVPLGELTEDSRLLPSAENGVIDMPAVLSILSQMGYDGPVTPAPSRGLAKGVRRDMLVKEAAESLTKAWKAAGLAAVGRPVAPARS